MKKNCVMCGSEFQARGVKKTCSPKCAQENKHIVSNVLAKERKAEWHKQNSERISAKAKLKYEKADKTRLRDLKYQNSYGITLEDYNQMFASQSGRCAICNIHEQESGKILCVDHDHNTGKVRGLLCSKCNAGIGLLGDDPDNLINAANYLREK